jgi:hypothetical protein
VSISVLDISVENFIADDEYFHGYRLFHRKLLCMKYMVNQMMWLELPAMPGK